MDTHTHKLPKASIYIHSKHKSTSRGAITVRQVGVGAV